MAQPKHSLRLTTHGLEPAFGVKLKLAKTVSTLKSNKLNQFNQCHHPKQSYDEGADPHIAVAFDAPVSIVTQLECPPR